MSWCDQVVVECSDVLCSAAAAAASGPSASQKPTGLDPMTTTLALDWPQTSHGTLDATSRWAARSAMPTARSSLPIPASSAAAWASSIPRACRMRRACSAASGMPLTACSVVVSRNDADCPAPRPGRSQGVRDRSAETVRLHLRLLWNGTTSTSTKIRCTRTRPLSYYAAAVRSGCTAALSGVCVAVSRQEPESGGVIRAHHTEVSSIECRN